MSSFEWAKKCLTFVTTPPQAEVLMFSDDGVSCSKAWGNQECDTRKKLRRHADEGGDEKKAKKSNSKELPAKPKPRKQHLWDLARGYFDLARAATTLHSWSSESEASFHRRRRRRLRGMCFFSPPNCFTQKRCAELQQMDDRRPKRRHPGCRFLQCYRKTASWA